MRCFAYATRFTGRATPASADGAVLRVAATAPASAFAALVGPDGLAGTFDPVAGGEATVAAEVTFTGATSFQVVGAIAFGAGNVLRVVTVGSGYLGASADPGRKHGTAMRRVDGGEGRFVGASGLITSNFVLADDGGVVDYHLGVILVN